MPSLVAEDIWFRYSPATEYVLRGASLSAESGDFVALVGPMGSGKTTLLMILAGLLEPERGVIEFNGSRKGAPRQHVGILFQDPDEQLFNPTVYDEIAYALRTLGLSEEEVKRRVLSVAERLGISRLLDKPPHRLSYGQKKLVALASILVYDPSLLLLDEPTTNIDKYSFSTILSVLREHLAMGGIIIAATHDLDLVLRASTKTCILIEGRVKCYPTWSLVENGGLEEAPVPQPLALEALLEISNRDWRSVAAALRRIARHTPREGTEKP